jgi:hypothetical protein
MGAFDQAARYAAEAYTYQQFMDVVKQQTLFDVGLGRVEGGGRWNGGLEGFAMTESQVVNEWLKPGRGQG